MSGTSTTGYSQGTHLYSTLLAGNRYEVAALTPEESGVVEELTDSLHQERQTPYFPITKGEQRLWLVPFDEKAAESFRPALLQAFRVGQGHPALHFPLDLVTHAAYVQRPIDRIATEPIRIHLPTQSPNRWKTAVEIFSLVGQLHEMGLTSHGISREQVRIHPETGIPELWLNHTVSLIGNSGCPHYGFHSIPTSISQEGVTGIQRDVFSAAVMAFYLLEHNHPFVGSDFWPLLRKNYLDYYHYKPSYIFDPIGSNGVGNQPFGELIERQWQQTSPELQALFDGLFLSVNNKNTFWKSDAPWWNVSAWLQALERELHIHENDLLVSPFRFADEHYHLV